MPAFKPKRPQAQDQMVSYSVDSFDSTDRAVTELARVMDVQNRPSRSRVTADLVVGANTITHNLGRQAQHVTVMPTVADATFAWAVTSMTDKQITLTVVGIAQNNASVEIS